jgi:hypothetical protein
MASSANHQQDCRGGEGQLCVDTQASVVKRATQSPQTHCFESASDRINDRETNTSEEHPDSDGEHHDGVIDERRETIDEGHKAGVRKRRCR